MAERVTPQVTDDWHRLYKKGWKGAIVDEAFAHPAKFARDLIRAIYNHAVEEGWLKPGDKVLDPFGGVALGALDAMRLGLHWVGMELEPKFVGLGTRNIHLWDGQFKSVIPGWGTAWLYQGDSRYLVVLLGRANLGGAQVSLSSPPFGAGETRDRQPVQDGSVSDCITRAYTQDRQGEMEGNLAHLDDGEGFEMAVSSPPFQGSVGSDDPDKRGGLYRDPKRRGDVSLTGTYGETPGQLGAMDGEFRATVGSPPFQSQEPSHARAGEPSRDRLLEGSLKGRAVVDSSYGDTPGQLSALPGSFRGAVGSPPFEESLSGKGTCPEARPDGSPFGQGKSIDLADYGSTPDQLGSLSGDLDASISSPPWERGAEGGLRGEKFKDPEAFAAQLNADDQASPDRHDSSVEARLAQMERDQERVYGGTTGNVGNEEAETFWSAARTIVSQVYQLLSPGGVAIWVCKDFVRKGKRVPFTHQWAQLCVSVGFEWLHEHRCWVVEDNGTQLGLFSEEDDKDMIKERKSFFRRLAERRGSPRIDYESVLCLRKPL